MSCEIPVVGVVGGGQLARMLLAPAARLALPVALLADVTDPASEFCASVVPGVGDADGLRRLARRCDVLTVEHELVDLAALTALEGEGRAVRPSSAALRTATDKLRQRELLGEHGVPVAPWTLAREPSDVLEFAADHGWPLVLKRPRGGYDGRGVFEVADPARAAHVLAVVGEPMLLEPRLPLDHELAVLVVRRPGGQTAVYPAVATHQEGAMCREVLLPAPVGAEVGEEARHVAERAAEIVGVVGVLAVELFVSQGRVVLNELAARPHNAGHVTIEGTTTSQFENHLRAVADLPLGSTALRSPSAMVNVIGGDGDPRRRLADALALEDVAVHLYGKSARPGRKLGHVTAWGPDVHDALARARRAAALLQGG